MSDDLPGNFRKLVHSAVDPMAVFQRAQCRALVREFYRRFGPEVLINILVAVDDMEQVASAVIADKNEVETYVFSKYGIYDEEIFMKMQLTETWEQFQADLLELSGRATQEAIEEVLSVENFKTT
jgi:hypothetical protein